ncbi:hypothetical protein [Niveispirillum sp. BGYR6]|uniref:hypothetical protein n=1 Tax=Niveispirillum sp. BGYR6 TaxID=2971249 RepID=UPI0022B9A36F|nr:hypothetical protein [Niveispirillum sp. BGYR6]MDG5497726.1 hypothetical protein [Niveispirillum sp. BGYR6]
MKRVFLLPLLLVLSGCATIVDEATPFTASSPDGLLLLELVDVPADKSAIALFDPFICPLPQGARKPDMNAIHGCPRSNIVESADGKSRFAAYQMPPGRYVMERLQVQARWAACFNGGTKAFEVAAGKVTYLGALHLAPHVAEIGAATPIVAYQSSYYTVFDTPRPALDGPDKLPGWQARVGAFMSASMPRVAAPLVAAAPESATFETAQGIFDRVCTNAYE